MTKDPAAAEEVTRLRDCVNDLVGIMALPAEWTVAEPAQIMSTLLDALLGMLRLGFVFVRLHDPDGGRLFETMRVAEPLQGATAAEISGAINSSLDDTPSKWPPRAQIIIRDVDLTVASAPLGLRGELGIIVAGCPRTVFPTQTERLLLDVTANQAAIGLQHRHLLNTQKRHARDLDEHVDRRTSQPAAADTLSTQEVAERRRADEALRERESRLILDTIPGLVGILTAAGEVDVVNHELVEYCGQPLEAMRQWGTNGTVHSDDLPRVGQVFTQAIAAGAPYDFEARIRRFDGVYRWCQVRGLPLRDTNGGIARWYVLLTDIDERKHAAEALAASERNLKLTIDTIPVLAWSARPDGSAEFFNQHYLNFMGFSAEQASGWGWTAAVHPEDVNGLAATWQHIMASEAPGEAEARLRRDDGTYRWFLFRTNPLRDESGAIVKWYGVNTDIEDRKRAEVELRRAHDSFADAQRLSKTGSFITDLVGDDHNWSEETYRIFEFEPGTKVSVQRIQAIIHPDDRPSFESMIARAMSGVDVNFSFRILPAHAAEKHVRGIAHVIEKIEGRPMFVGALQDATESMMAEEALNKARSELAHVSRITTVSTLTASIAHEINQPLAGIITNAGTCLRMLAADPPDVDGARETARRTIRDGNRASDVITRLRALFSKKEFTLESLDLNDATREVIALSLSDLQRQRVVLQSELAEDLPNVTGDRVQLQQVILNLVRNASDAMTTVEHRPRQLLVRTEREIGDRVRVMVRDSGMGLDRQSMDKLFDAFYTTKSGGMGIGLSVSRSIVERHHGRIWAEPNDGPGATFSFSIPTGGVPDTTPGVRSS